MRIIARRRRGPHFFPAIFQRFCRARRRVERGRQDYRDREKSERHFADCVANDIAICTQMTIITTTVSINCRARRLVLLSSCRRARCGEPQKNNIARRYNISGARLQNDRTKRWDSVSYINRWRDSKMY